MHDKISFISTTQGNIPTQKREQGFSWERRDCTVIALSLVCGISYKEAHQYLKERGRKDRQGWYWRGMGREKEFVFGHLVTSKRFPYYHDERQPEKAGMMYDNYWGCTTLKYKYNIKRTTVKQFIKDHPLGKYVLLVQGHVFTVIDGVPHDWKNPQYKEVEASYEFTKVY